jgi:hypothetical protein
MRRAQLSLALAIAIAACCSFAASQATDSQAVPNNQGTSTPSSPQSGTDLTQPQTGMPPDTKAPAPSAAPKPMAASNLPQSDQPPRSTEPRYLAAGTTIRASLDTPLSTRTSKVGDRFTATVDSPVRDSNGNELVPTGAKVNGQISEQSSERVASAIKDMGHLNLRFTDIQLPDGTDIPVNATLLSVHRTPVARPGNAANAQVSSTAVASRSGMAATFGAPIKGLAVGNLAGGGYILAMNGKQVDLPADCGLRLRIDRNTPVP